MSGIQRSVCSAHPGPPSRALNELLGSPRSDPCPTDSCLRDPGDHLQSFGRWDLKFYKLLVFNVEQIEDEKLPRIDSLLIFQGQNFR